MNIKVVLVEDEEEIRKLTVSLLNLYSDIECIGAFADAESFLTAFPQLRPDVVLMDIELPGQSGIECVSICKSTANEVDFVMFTNNYNNDLVYDALAAGAVGYVLKGGEPEQLARALREVKAGGSPMSRQISRLVIDYFQKRAQKKCPTLDTLTNREWEVLRGLDKGWAYKQIAAHHFVATETIRTQVRSIYRKLQVNTRTEALNKLHCRE
jgi:DNA-binding NarL/FixJ family response regulator